jgi:hypothetical protein
MNKEKDGRRRCAHNAINCELCIDLIDHEILRLTDLITFYDMELRGIKTYLLILDNKVESIKDEIINISEVLNIKKFRDWVADEAVKNCIKKIKKRKK